MMTYLFAVGMLLILALIVLMAMTKAQKSRSNLAEAAKMRAEMRSNTKDVWAANVQVRAVIHDPEPIKYDMSVHADEDLTDSQYQVLKAIFAETHPEFRSSTDHARLEEDYWADTDHTRISE